MVNWSGIFRWKDPDRRHLHDELQALLPVHRQDGIHSAIPAKEVTHTALRLKYMLEQVIPCELPEEAITKPHSSVITEAVAKMAKSAGKISGRDEDYGSCVIYCLLIAKSWFKRQARLELWDADLHQLRAVACEKLCKMIIEEEEDVNYLMQELLLKRYSILVDGEDTKPSNAIEKAVDLHAVIAIGSSGYQKCINYLWRGWLIQDEDDPSRFVDYKWKTSDRYWDHFDPDRMRVPQYQNIVQILISIIYLALFTGAVNTLNINGEIDPVEALLYIFTLGFICDEAGKFWKVGRFYLGFWNIFNCTLYALLTVSFVIRMAALGYESDTEERKNLVKESYNFLSVTAPMFWMRILLYLDGFRFFGAMLVILKVMMKESLIFFALLIVILIGFLQGFIGLDQASNWEIDAVGWVMSMMVNAILGDPNFDDWEKFSPPFGLILYYIYNFIIIVILLNVLIALFNSAYEDITSNAIDEYLALYAQKTMQFVRAPDENVFIAPFNLIEIFGLVLPFEWWMPKHHYERLNDIVMGALYGPLLFVTAFIEVQTAKKVKFNRSRNEVDEDTVEEWEQLEDEIDFEGTGWAKRVEENKPNVIVDGTLLQVQKIRDDLKHLTDMVEKMQNASASGGSRYLTQA